MKISVVGLGKLGSCTAACIASKGLEVLGVDLNEDFVAAVNSGKAPVHEPFLQETIVACRGRLTATTRPADAIDATDVTLLVVPTPSRPDGHFSSAALEASLKSLGHALARSAKPSHLFVIVSTVSPQTTEKVLIPLIENSSGRKLNAGFEVCYNPEFIALGTVIRDFLNPDLVLIGESSPSAGAILVDLYSRVCDNKPHFSRMSITSAEICKISLNAFVTMKISFANFLCGVCENIPTADIDAVTRALGADRRISPYYLKGGMGFGGPCFPRDNRAFAAFAAQFGADAVLAKAVDTVNAMTNHRLAQKVAALVPKGANGHSCVAIYGMAYKPGTPVVEESPSLLLAKSLVALGVRVTTCDLVAEKSVRSVLGEQVTYARSLRACFEAAPVVVLALPDTETAKLDESYIKHDPTVIVDCWRTLQGRDLGPRSRIAPLGVADDSLFAVRG